MKAMAIKMKNKRIIKQERKLKIENRQMLIIFNLRKAYFNGNINNGRN